jgi:hypothetical protein
MLAIADPKARVETGLDAVAPRGAGGGEGLGQQDQERDHHADERRRKADRADARLDGRRRDLGQPDHGHQGHQEQGQASQCGSPGRRIGVLLTLHHLPAGGQGQ